jgi:chromosome segregation ATPase
MTEDQEKLLAVLGVRMNDLLSLCEGRKHKIEELTELLNQEYKNMQQAKQEIQGLKAKYSDLLTAYAASVSISGEKEDIKSLEMGDIKDARSRLSKLVREVDNCIKLLNG